MKTYEAVFILNEKQVKDGGEALNRDIVEHLQKQGGRVLYQNNMGRHQLARPIKKQNTAIYLNYIFEMEPGDVETLKERYRLNPSVFRSSVFVYEGPPIKET